MERPLSADFAEYLTAERGLSPTTVATYAAEARAFETFLTACGRAPEQADASDVEAYMTGRRVRDIDPRTLAKASSAIRSFYRFLVLEGKVGVNPARLVDPQRVTMRIPRYLAAEEIEKLLDACDTGRPLGIRDRALFELIYSCGLRVSEAVGLTVARVSLPESAVRVMGKGSRERMVPLGRRAKEELRGYLSVVRPALAGHVQFRVALELDDGEIVHAPVGAGQLRVAVGRQPQRNAGERRMTGVARRQLPNHGDHRPLHARM